MRRELAPIHRSLTWPNRSAWSTLMAMECRLFLRLPLPISTINLGRYMRNDHRYPACNLTLCPPPAFRPATLHRSLLD